MLRPPDTRRDVAKSEKLLGDAGTLDLKKTDGPTGHWGTRTSDATKTFQKNNGLKVDGQINPNCETIRALGKLAGQAAKAATEDSQTPVVIPGSIRDPNQNAVKLGPGLRRDDKDA